MPLSQGKLVLGYRGHVELSLREEPRESTTPRRWEHSTMWLSRLTEVPDLRCLPGALRGGGTSPHWEGWLTSCALKAFLSVKSSSFHTTSTPSSVSMARKVLWMPGMFP